MKKNEKALLHSIDESPGKKAIYVFLKVDGFAAPILEYTRLTRNGGRVCDMMFDDGRVPVAWCYATDLMKVFGWESMLKKSSSDIARYRIHVSLYKNTLDSIFLADSPDDDDNMMAHNSGFFDAGVIRGAVDAETMENVKKWDPDLIEE